MVKIVDQNKFGVVSYIVSTEAEIAQLPKDGIVGQGSTAFVIATSNVFMYDEEANAWKQIQ